MAEQVPAEMYNQSAVIPFRVENGTLEIALITSASGRRWVIPKGVIDPGETAAESAEREAMEEAGVMGPLSEEPIGTYTYDKWGGTCTVQVFLMHVVHVAEEWPEADQRMREWVPYDEAGRRVHEHGLKDLVFSLPDLLS